MQVKTILYCLDQMKKPVHKDIRDIIVQLDIDQFLEQWLVYVKKFILAIVAYLPVSSSMAILKNMIALLVFPFKKARLLIFMKNSFN